MTEKFLLWKHQRRNKKFYCRSICVTYDDEATITHQPSGVGELRLVCGVKPNFTCSPRGRGERKFSRYASFGKTENYVYCAQSSSSCLFTWIVRFYNHRTRCALLFQHGRGEASKLVRLSHSLIRVELELIICGITSPERNVRASFVLERVFSVRAATKNLSRNKRSRNRLYEAQSVWKKKLLRQISYCLTTNNKKRIIGHDVILEPHECEHDSYAILR